jgi:ornithine carbamoyltransferase
MMRQFDLLSLKDLSAKQIMYLVDLASKTKKNKKKYANKMKGKTLLMIFSKPSLRTRLSFDIGMNQLGGHSIFYDLKYSTLGKKESIKDFGKVVDGYVDIIMARLYKQSDLNKLAKWSEVPVINGLTNDYHPCQILGDLLTIKEKLGKLKGIKLTYVGDANNNVAHSLIIACWKLGIECVISCPKQKKFMPDNKEIGKAKYKFVLDPKKAVKNADMIYTDTWMSYQVPKKEKMSRKKILKKFQVNSDLMKIGRKAGFMHCLPAHRGDEVTSSVLDSKKSWVYDQAENRTYAEKAVILWLLGKK